MRIGIDANWLIYEEAGIGQYSYNLIKNLLKHDRENEYVLFFNYFKKPEKRIRKIQELVEDSKAKVELSVSVIPVRIKQWLITTKFPLSRIYKAPIDLYYSPFFAGIPKVGWEKQVVTIHDLAFINFPDHRGQKISDYYFKTTKNALEKCQKIIAVSKNTKEDLIKDFKVKSEKIKVIYEGADNRFKPINKIPPAFYRKYPFAKKKFILSVCTLEPRKNLPRLIKAYAALPYALQQEFRLILIGKDGWNNREIFSTINDLNLSKKIIMPGYLTGDDLPYFYNLASVFVYPSLYEGFGLPVLEAMSCKTPVLTSRVSSLPEVAGKAALYFDPYKEQEIFSELKKSLLSPDLRKKMGQKSLKQSKLFSWEKAAKETIALFNKMS